jgi:hypothetical protein
MSLESQLDLEIAQEIVEMKEIIGSKLTAAFQVQKDFTESRQEVPIPVQGADTGARPF